MSVTWYTFKLFEDCCYTDSQDLKKSASERLHREWKLFPFPWITILTFWSKVLLHIIHPKRWVCFINNCILYSVNYGKSKNQILTDVQQFHSYIRIILLHKALSSKFSRLFFTMNSFSEKNHFTEFVRVLYMLLQAHDTY